MTSTRIGLVGYGNMGKAVEQALAARGEQPVCRIDPVAEGCSRSIDAETLRGVDVCIEFTEPGTVLDNMRAIAATGTTMVVGTTGWQENLDEVRDIVRKADIGFLWASNFSVGVHMLGRIAVEAARLVNLYAEYDIAIHEVHHTAKKDAPSGTALTLADSILRHLENKDRVGSVPREGLPDARTLYVSAQRVGAVNGQHSVLIDGPADSIELTHTARNRTGFAHGALLAAAWMKDRKGFYSIEDMFHDIESV